MLAVLTSGMTHTSLAGSCQEQQLWQQKLSGKTLNPMLVLVGFCAGGCLLLPFDIWTLNCKSENAS